MLLLHALQILCSILLHVHMIQAKISDTMQVCEHDWHDFDLALLLTDFLYHISFLIVHLCHLIIAAY